MTMTPREWREEARNHEFKAKELRSRAQRLVNEAITEEIAVHACLLAAEAEDKRAQGR